MSAGGPPPAEAAELEQLRALRDALDGLPVAVAVWELGGPHPGDLRLRYANARAALEWGDELAAGIGRSLRELLPEALDDPRPNHLPTLWHRVARSGTPESVDPLPYGDLDRPVGYLRAQAVPAGPGRVAVLLENISRQVQAEKQLQLLNRELEQRVRERTARLDELNQELSAFSYTVSHDLRAPLRAIQGFSEAMAEDCAGQLPDAALDYLRRIQAASQSLRHRIDGVLALARLARTELLHQTVHLSDRVERILRRLLAAEPGRDVKADIQPGLSARADPRLADLLIENLLSNALKFSAGKPTTQLRFGLDRSRGQTAFFLSDDGVGFDQGRAARIFEPFARLHPADAYPGSGVGLATAARVVQLHGGRIWAQSSPGQGATFWFTL